MRSVELFAGAGGLGMGLALAGFEHAAAIERDPWACDTLTENQRLGFPLTRGWRVHRGDVREFDFKSIGEVDLVSGGPPCQPFSLGGRHRGHEDARDMFPAAAEAVRQLAPRAFLFENVKGITRQSFANYFQYILLRLAFPEFPKKRNEEWTGHLERLERRMTSARESGLRYRVAARVLNAADYGVPQLRERVFIAGFRYDVEAEWNFPAPTHSMEALLGEQWITGEYWERHKVPKRKRPGPPPRHLARIGRLGGARLPGFGDAPWRTVRDALEGLPDPRSAEAARFFNHTFQPGARTYKGHTGSPLDWPAKTLKAGDHGVPGGENMLVTPAGAIRYFTVREAARLQTFPDEYRFHGSWSETMRQLGNAVPVALARVVGASIARHLARCGADSAGELPAKAG